MALEALGAVTPFRSEGFFFVLALSAPFRLRDDVFDIIDIFYILFGLEPFSTNKSEFEAHAGSSPRRQSRGDNRTTSDVTLEGNWFRGAG